MRIYSIFYAAVFALTGLTVMGEAATVVRADRSKARTAFQTHAPYTRLWDIRSDAAIVYGAHDGLTSRTTEWKKNGYVVHFMTGSAWGDYADYFEGKFDGKIHADEGQVDGAGNVIWHHPGVPYIVPTPSFIEYLKSLCRTAIDAGAEALFLEEPEFWSRAGYSESFKRLWRGEYGEEWKRPDSSPDAFWRAAKLKYFLYKRALEQVFAHAKAYAREKGREVQCFVPTHSLINYAQWAIVSPESSMMHLDNCDGYIAQVWTGTARQKNMYRGVLKERTFETAFLEYSTMFHMVEPTGRKVYFLHDPVEDDPNHTWDDYKSNYERTVVASLMFPEVKHFEVMPWPNRIMDGDYPAGSFAPDPNAKIKIPESYASEIMTVINALNELPDYDYNNPNRLDVPYYVLVSDTMMFQRGSPWDSDPHFSGYYGLAVSLLKCGVQVKHLVLEQVLEPEALPQRGIILMSYEHMKPLRPEYNEALAQWVRDGHTLVYFGEEKDRFHSINEWWRTDKDSTETARSDLFRRLGISGEPTSVTKCGKGDFRYTTFTAQQIAERADGDDIIWETLMGSKSFASRTILTRRQGMHHFRGSEGESRRDGFEFGANFDEGPGDLVQAEPQTSSPFYIDLFTSHGEVKKGAPGDVYFARTIPAASEAPKVLASNARMETATITPGRLQLVMRGPTVLKSLYARVLLPGKPKSIAPAGATFRWHEETNTALILVPNREAPPEIEVTVTY